MISPIYVFDSNRLYTEAIQFDENQHQLIISHVALFAQSWGATNEGVLMCDIHLHAILMRAEFCFLCNEGFSSQTAGQPLQLVKL